jgi:hypothetical protein
MEGYNGCYGIMLSRWKADGTAEPFEAEARLNNI